MATIWKMTIDGEEHTQLTETASFRPSFSSDGKFIAYDFFDEGQSKRMIGVIRSEGGQPIKTFDLSGSLIRWSPNGQGLTYVKGSNIWLQPLTGRPLEQLTDFKDQLIWGYAWSSDGEKLACERVTPTRDIVLISDSR